MASGTIIAPSILSADFTRLADECQAVLDAGADWLHVDVMDGHFVPNITIGLPVVESLRKTFPNVVLDVHIMISNPDFYAAKFIEAGADIVSFHPEATPHTHKVIQDIHRAGGKASLAINPSTPLNVVEWVIQDVDMILVMSVNPGFGGQSFIDTTLPRLEALRELIERAGRTEEIDVEVDGGIRPDNVAAVQKAGANVFVAGSAIFGAQSYKDAIFAMRQQIDVR